MKIEVEKDTTYFLCSCEKSEKYPFCDGAHRGSGKRSIVYVAKKTGTIVLDKEEIVEL